MNEKKFYAHREFEKLEGALMGVMGSP